MKGKGKGILGARGGQGAREEGGRKEGGRSGRKEGGRRGGKHVEGLAILLLEVALCHRKLSGHLVVMLPRVDNLTKVLKRSVMYKTSEVVLPV